MISLLSGRARLEASIGSLCQTTGPPGSTFVGAAGRAGAAAVTSGATSMDCVDDLCKSSLVSLGTRRLGLSEDCAQTAALTASTSSQGSAARGNRFCIGFSYRGLSSVCDRALIMRSKRAGGNSFFTRAAGRSSGLL